MISVGNLIKLHYTVTDDGGSTDYAYNVSIDRVPCPYGGARVYFLCPGTRAGRTCYNRVTKLYQPPGCNAACKNAHPIKEARDARLSRRAPKTAA